MDADSSKLGNTAANSSDPRESDYSAPGERTRNMPQASAMVATINESLLGLSPSVAVAGQFLGSGLASQTGFFAAATQYQHQGMVALAATTADVCRLLSASGSASRRKAGSAAGSKSVASSAELCEDALKAADAAVTNTGF